MSVSHKRLLGSMSKLCLFSQRWYGGVWHAMVRALTDVDGRTVTRRLEAVGARYDNRLKRHVIDAVGTAKNVDEALGDLSKLHGLWAMLAVDHAIHGTEAVMRTPVHDVAEHWPQPDARMTAALLEAISLRREMHVEYMGKYRTVSGHFSPHRLVRTPFRVHVRGAFVYDGSANVTYRDFVLTRFMEVRPGRPRAYVGERDDRAWHEFEEVILELSNPVEPHMSATIRFEASGDTVRFKTRKALRRYAIQCWTQRAYGDMSESFWSVQ